MSTPHFETEAIRTQIERSQFLEHSSPLYLTSSYIFEDAEDMRASFAEEKERNIYSRFTNPNTSEFVDKICKLEGAESGYAFATGMSAVFSTFAALLNAGDHIVSARSVFESTHTLFTKFLPKWNIETSYFKAIFLKHLKRVRYRILLLRNRGLIQNLKSKISRIRLFFKLFRFEHNGIGLGLFQQFFGEFLDILWGN